MVARRIASVPRRTSEETWQRVIELVSEPGSAARRELVAITPVAALLIAEEYTSLAPVTISGGEPLVRIYTLHGNDAVDHDLDDETGLAFNPTFGDLWTLSIPAIGSDVDAARSAIGGADHIEIRDADLVDASDRSARTAHARDLLVDIEELERP